MAEIASITTHTPEKIHFEISDMLSKGVTYIDALVEYSKKHDIEIETVAEIVKKSPIIKEKIRSEAISMKLIRKDKNDVTICD